MTNNIYNNNINNSNNINNNIELIRGAILHTPISTQEVIDCIGNRFSEKDIPIIKKYSEEELLNITKDNTNKNHQIAYTYFYLKNKYYKPNLI